MIYLLNNNIYMGIGDWGLGPIPNPQSPNPQSPIPHPQLRIIRNCLIINNYINNFTFIYYFTLVNYF